MPKSLRLKDVLTFGKYKGNTVSDVLYCNPSYLVWANDNIEWFKLEHDIYTMAINEVFNDRMYRYLRREFNFHRFYDDDVYDPF